MLRGKPLTALAVITCFCAYLVCTAGPQEERPTQPVLLQTVTDRSAPLLPSLASAETEELDVLIDDQAPLQLLLPPPPPSTVTAATEPEPPAGAEDLAQVPYRHVWAIVTAYCPCPRCCGNHSDGRTSTGTTAWKRGVAADPKVMEYGTHVFIPGYGDAVIDDTGGAMRRAWRARGMIHLDVRMTYHHEARRWGRRLLKVRVYEKP